LRLIAIKKEGKNFVFLAEAPTFETELSKNMRIIGNMTVTDSPLSF